MQSKLRIVPCTLKDANAYVDKYHRHHDSVVGHKWSIGVIDPTGLIRGIAIVGRPKARALDSGMVAEVTRLATDGCPNACSALYGACARIAKNMGYDSILTYILATEPGTSLKAAGWRYSHDVKGRSWDTPSRRREDATWNVDKKCYVLDLNEAAPTVAFPEATEPAA